VGAFARALGRSLAARQNLIARYQAWGQTARDRSRPLLWMHAPSVGEGLQARPVLEMFRARRPDVQLAYTFFSPSAEAFARRLDVDFAEYLPFDTTRSACAALDALQPTALVYAKLDVWPVLTREAQRRGVPLGLVSATVAPGSSRNRGMARALLHDAYAALDAVGAVGDDDARRLEALGVASSAVQVTGDTRYDQVAARARLSSSSLALLRSARATLVAGHWPSDGGPPPRVEALRRAVPGVRLIIAPYEPIARHLAPTESWGGPIGRVARLDTRTGVG
jgi:3-deoxy-D-manno-octulosonic-acid transferase